METSKLRSDRFSPNGELKKCSGFLHKDNPVWLPLVKFHTLKSGRRAGKPMSECMECWRARLGRAPQNGRVLKAEWQPVLNALVRHLGSKAEIARRLGKSKAVFSKQRDSMGAEAYRELQQLLAQVERDNGIRGVSGNSEPEVIDNEPFATILLKFFDDWMRDRPQQARGPKKLDFTYSDMDEDLDRSSSKIQFYGPWEWLEEKTGIDRRRIYAFSRKEMRYIPATQADKLLQAMNLTHLISGLDPVIQIIPNPQWSMEAYQRYMRARGCI